jgi:hypothetical protein
MSRRLQQLQALPIRTRIERATAEQRIRAAYQALATKIGARRQYRNGAIHFRKTRGTDAELRELIKIAEIGGKLRALQVMHGEIPEIGAAVEGERLRFATERRKEAERRATRGRQADRELTAAIVRLRDEVLPNGKHRTWKEVRAALRKLNRSWKLPGANGIARIRMRYRRAKKV